MDLHYDFIEVISRLHCYQGYAELLSLAALATVALDSLVEGRLTPKEVHRPEMLGPLIFHADPPSGDPHIEMLSTEPIRRSVLYDLGFKRSLEFHEKPSLADPPLTNVRQA